MEYQVCLLDPKYKLAIREDREPLFSTDDLCRAIEFGVELYTQHREPIGVWQPRLEIFREQWSEWE